MNGNGDIEVRDITNSFFGAGIIWGNVGDEFELDLDMAGTVSYQFQDYLIRTGQDLTGPEYTDVNTNPNSDPDFDNPSTGNYRLTSSSTSAIDRSFILYGGATDMDGEIQSGTSFDLGCYEYQQ